MLSLLLRAFTPSQNSPSGQSPAAALISMMSTVKYVDAAEIVNLAAVAVIETRVVLSLIKHGDKRCILPGASIIMIAYAIRGNDLSQMTGESRLHVCGRRVINAVSMAVVVAFVCVG